MKRISHLTFSSSESVFHSATIVHSLSTCCFIHSDYRSLIGLRFNQTADRQLPTLGRVECSACQICSFDTTNTLTNTASSLSNDTHLRQLLTANYLDDQEAIVDINSYDQLDEIRNLQTSIAKLTIYTTNQTIPNYKYFQQADDTIQATAWYQRALKQPDAF